MANHAHAVRKVCIKLADAQDVFLLGSFNNWSTTATPMRQSAQGLWEVSLALPQELGQVCYFVWKQGLRFGRLLRDEQVQALGSGQAVA